MTSKHDHIFGTATCPRQPRVPGVPRVVRRAHRVRVVRASFSWADSWRWMG